jgi:hypothetical protein
MTQRGQFRTAFDRNGAACEGIVASNRGKIRALGSTGRGPIVFKINLEPHGGRGQGVEVVG